tara:strand:+ start:281 stop:412 length:132 start_codon:yes stop_codon:yes gene_type:complete
MSFRQRKLRADGDNEMDWGKIAMYSGIAIVVVGAIYLVYKKVK